MAHANVTREKRNTTINLRIQKVERDLIDQAAEMTGKNRTEFVLDSARRAAEAVLLDRHSFRLEPAAMRHFMQRLDAPPSPEEGLLELFTSIPPWE